MKLYYIQWEDVVDSNEWKDKFEKDEFVQEDVIVSEVGWIIEETKKHVILTSSYIKDKHGDIDYGHLVKIPKNLIRVKKLIDIKY